MKKLLFLFASLFIISTNLSAAISDDLEAITAKNIAIGIVDQLKAQGEFANADEATLDMAKELVTSIVNNPNLLDDFKNGDLVLDEQFVADYFIKDTIQSIGTTVSSVGSSIVNTLSGIGGRVFSTIKDLAGGIASIANKALSAITDNDAVMFLLETGIGIFNKLIPIGATVLGSALLFIPGAEVLIPVVAAVTPILMAVVTPTNVTTALKVAAATAKLADAFLNRDKASLAAGSSMVLALEAKSQKVSKKEAGKALKMGLAGGKAIQEFLHKNLKKLSKTERRQLTLAADKANKLTTLLDTKKLK
jgi:hypothetical protein